MTSKTNIKQVLADLRAELTDRHSKATASQQRKAELTQRISQLQGAMALDGVDLSARIQQAQAELAEANKLLSTWPDVKAELQRRIGEAESALAQEQRAANVERWHEVSALEAAQRREFAQAVVALAEIAQRLRATIDERQALFTTLMGVLPGSRPLNWLPEFRADWVYAGKVSDAKQALAEWLR
jgi:predicted nuclease with TOPRIM domain